MFMAPDKKRTGNEDNPMETALLRLANLRFDYSNRRDTHKDVERLLRDYPDIFANLPEGSYQWATGQPAFARNRKWDALVGPMLKIQLAIDAADERSRDWHLFQMRLYYFTVTNPKAVGVPPLTAFERAVYHFQRIAHKAKHCQNPECPAPYFLAKKKGQKYCTEDCAADSQKEYKRKWWNENRGAGRKK